jgi:hypothetical protein
MYRVLFDGLKSFWALKTSVRILIVEHSYLDVLEIIVYDTLAEFEAERVYVCALTLRAILESRKVSVLVDICTSGIPATMLSSGYDTEVCTFICHHLFIGSYMPVSKRMDVTVRSSYRDNGDSELMVSKPDDLRSVELSLIRYG